MVPGFKSGEALAYVTGYGILMDSADLYLYRYFDFKLFSTSNFTY